MADYMSDVITPHPRLIGDLLCFVYCHGVFFSNRTREPQWIIETMRGPTSNQMNTAARGQTDSFGTHGRPLVDRPWGVTRTPTARDSLCGTHCAGLSMQRLQDRVPTVSTEGVFGGDQVCARLPCGLDECALIVVEPAIRCEMRYGWVETRGCNTGLDPWPNSLRNEWEW